MKMNKKYLVVILLFISLLINGTIENINAKENKLKKAPNFSLQDLTGKMITHKEYQNKIVLIDFWATWCPPCRMEIPHLIEIQEKYRDKGVIVIGIALDNPVTVKSFVNKSKINYPVLIGDRKVQRDFGGIQGIPTLFLITKKWEIYKKYYGYTEKEELEKDIEILLKNGDI